MKLILAASRLGYVLYGWKGWVWCFWKALKFRIFIWWISKPRWPDTI